MSYHEKLKMKAPIKLDKNRVNSEELKRLIEIKRISSQLVNVIISTNQVLNLEVSEKLIELMEKL